MHTCRKHPRYKGKGIPTSKCPMCLMIYALKHPRKPSPVPPAVTMYVVRTYSGGKLVNTQLVENASVQLTVLPVGVKP